MRLLRSWPAVLNRSLDRPHIIDHIEKFPIMDYDYHGLADMDDDILLLEWDIAISWEDLQEFMARANHTPDIVRVAPYRLYEGRRVPVWAHRVVWSTTDLYVTPEEDTTCDLFGFGCIYLPKRLLQDFHDTNVKERCRDPRYHGSDYNDGRLTDQTFSTWHHWYTRQPPVPIDWSIKPIHLNWG
jgi:hypothetical protein